MPDLRSWGPMTTLLVIVAAIIVAVGGAVTILNPDSLSFQDYLDALWKLALAAAGLGIGRGYMKGKQAEADTAVEAAGILPAPEPVQVTDDEPTDPPRQPSQTGIAEAA